MEEVLMWETATKFVYVINVYKNKDTVNINELNVFAKREKLIIITGIKKIPDSLVSVYNTYGIAAASLFDDQLAYTFELAVPIKYLNLADNSGGTFNYQIKINPDPTINKPGAMTADMPPPLR